MAGRKGTGTGKPRRRRSKAGPVAAADARPADADTDTDTDGDGDGAGAEGTDEPRAVDGQALGGEPADADADADPDAEVGPKDGELEEVTVDDVVVARAPLANAGDRGGIARRDPLTAYMQEIRRYPLLSREEEHDLAVKFYESGDPALAKQLITSNLRLVVKIAHEYRRSYRNLLDLVQEGNIGLMQAVRKYDPYRGVKLSSYAAWWIRAYILKFILNNWRMVKIGTTQAQRKLFFNLRKEKDKLERLTGEIPDNKLLAAKLDVSEAEVADMDMRLGASEASLDAPLGTGEDGPTRTRGDLLAGANELRPDVHVEGEQFRQLLRAKLDAFGVDLEGREKLLFEQRWLTETPQTLQEIGDKFGISRERARQIEKRLLDRLRKYLEQELGAAIEIGKAAED